MCLVRRKLLQIKKNKKKNILDKNILISCSSSFLNYDSLVQEGFQNDSNYIKNPKNGTSVRENFNLVGVNRIPDNEYLWIFITTKKFC